MKAYLDYLTTENRKKAVSLESIISNWRKMSVTQEEYKMVQPCEKLYDLSSETEA